MRCERHAENSETRAMQETSAVGVDGLFIKRCNYMASTIYNVSENILSVTLIIK